MLDASEKAEIEMLRDIKATHGGWRPWNGFAGRAERLAKRGLIVKAGITAMPPHVCYVITEAGEKALAEITGDPAMAWSDHPAASIERESALLDENQRLREKLARAESTIRDVAGSEEIPTSHGAYELCRDVARDYLKSEE